MRKSIYYRLFLPISALGVATVSVLIFASTVAPLSVLSPHPVPAPTPIVSVAPTPVPTLTPEVIIPALPDYDFSLSVPESPTVEADYFEDALFIGDSRTDGFHLYSGIKNGTFWAYKGVMVFDFHTKAVVPTEDGTKITMAEALTQNQYGKIYVMLGINELGWNNDESFRVAYKAMIETIKETQPHATIYVQSIIPISEEKARQKKQPSYLNNAQIDIYNAFIRAICLELQVPLPNVSEAMRDEEGLLPADITSDGIHFFRSHYAKWYDYLKIHTVDWSLYAPLPVVTPPPTPTPTISP